MSQKQNNKVVSFRRPPNGGNIGVVIFAAIFIYIIICVFMYFTQKHIESYQVKMGSLSSNNVYKGIALRDEEIISATKSGYINYYAREGQRVGVGNLVYTIDESGKLADYLNTNGEGTTLTDKDLSELKTEILGFVNSFDHEEFASVYDFKNSVQGMVQKLSSANILDNIDKINSSGVSELVSLCTAPATGIVVFSTDGYEQVQLEDMTEELFDTKKYEKTQLINNELVASGDPVYKISEDEDWSIVIPVDADKEKELLDAEYVNVKFLKNQDTSWGKVSSFTIPLGATINMDGTAIMQGVAVVFAAQAFGIHLTPMDYVTVVGTATLASIGTAGVPSVGLVTLTMVFNSVGLPVEAIGLIMGIDRILDMTRTAVNITGDAVCTTIVAHQNGVLDKKIFNETE